MSALCALCLAATLFQAPVEVRLEQVYPFRGSARLERSAAQKRAVVLIHGLKIHPFKDGQAARAEFHDWQKPSGPLVQALSKDADVFVLAYCQSCSLEILSQAPAFEQAVDRLRFMGYPEIILVGHSAGGVLARLFVEDHPRAPVTKVVQVCAPNLGSSWVKPDASPRKVQGPFLQSLSKNWRQLAVLERNDKRIPAHVQFLCVVGTMGTLGDGLVSCRSQWPEDLQRQGIPVIRLPTSHIIVMHSKKNAAVLAGLILRDHPRWPQFQVEASRAKILGKTAGP